MLKIKKELTMFVSFLMLIALCLEGLPLQKVQAATDAGVVSDSINNTLDRPVVTKLRNTNIGVKVYWDPVEGADYYALYRKIIHKSGETEWKRIVKTSLCEYTDDLEDIINGKDSYSYKVRAVKADENKNVITSPVSKPKTIRWMSKLRQEMISVKNTEEGISISTHPLTVTGLIIYRKEVSESSYTRIAKIRGFDYLDTDVKEGGAYSYKVCKFKGSSKSPVSAEKRIFRTGTPSLKLKKTTTAVKLSWPVVSGADGYEVYSSRNGSASAAYPYKKLTDTAETAYVDKEHIGEAERSYKVRAYCIVGGKKYYGKFSAAKAIG